MLGAASRCLTDRRSAATPAARGGSKRPSFNAGHYHASIRTRYGPGSCSALLDARFSEGKNELQMAAPQAERNMDPQGCSIRKLSDATEFLSK